MTAPLGGGLVVQADACEGMHRRVANVLVLGVGNILLSDEGIGVRVVEALQQRYRVPEGVEMVDGGTCGMDLLDLIAGRDHLILVDAVATGGPPGTVVRLEGDEIPALFRPDPRRTSSACRTCSRCCGCSTPRPPTSPSSAFSPPASTSAWS